MNCQECHDFIDAYLDNELGVAEVILLEQHLRDCAECQQLLESRKVVGALLDNPQLRFEIPDYLYGKIQSALPPASFSAKDRTGRKPVIPWFSVPLALAAALQKPRAEYPDPRRLPDRPDACSASPSHDHQSRALSP